MADTEGESLESWLNKATNPSNRQEDWEYILGFCDQVNQELEGPQISVRLLAHKIQSPQEWESLQALTVLEACMKNCGRRFHNEVGKFRFLNELIKVVSPKYLGDRVSESVKTKVIEMLFIWSVALPDEAKITEAYQMLKRQGVVTTDPEVSADKTLIACPPERPHNPIFDNEEKSRRLAELLKSKKPEDLQEANRLIKNMVKEDEVRAQKESQRTSTLLEVNTSVKLLNEMLTHFNREQATLADRELLKDLHDDCDKLRTAVFKMATETEDDDDGSLGEILQASDDLSHVISTYKAVVEGQDVRADTSGRLPSKCTNNANSSEILIDLTGLSVHSPPDPPSPAPQTTQSIPADLFLPEPVLEAPPLCAWFSSGQPDLRSSGKGNPNHPVVDRTPNCMSLMDEELLCLGKVRFSTLALIVSIKSFFSHQLPCNGLSSLSGSVLCMGGDSTTLSSLPIGVAGAPPALPYNKLPDSTVCPDSPLLQLLSSPLLARQGTASPPPEPSLANVFVPLDAIRPSRESPVTAYDKDGVCVILHFASDCPPGRPDVLVMVVSMLNTAPLLVKNVTLHAAVPKSMRVKLQPPSGTEMAPFNPILPPSAITQVMLLANPLKEKARMRYKLMFVLGDHQCTETGEVDTFPPVDRWGRL
uniref:Golgi associated, gamma adaptin ear containing, ARF binding protein 3a n=1 Tax=Electrophorus electricus TaxID=8005 RepID=A0A4W4H1N0_ELEEL